MVRGFFQTAFEKGKCDLRHYSILALEAMMGKAKERARTKAMAPTRLGLASSVVGVNVS